MAGIWNVNSAYNIDSKRIQKKISFVLGEQFAARVIDVDKVTNEAILKLLDGWQFSAQIDQSTDFTAQGLVKFQVEGYENGKLILKLLDSSIDEPKSTIISDTLEEQGINIKKDDYIMLEKMIKYKMPLTKENISKVKSFLDFQSKIIQDPIEEDNFIFRYLDNKHIQIDSPKGQQISNSLKGFFSEFKNLSLDKLLTLIENDIELTEQNIKSFNKINEKPMSLYNDLNNIHENLAKDGDKVINFKEIDKSIKEINTESAKGEVINSESKESSSLSKNNVYIQNAYASSDIKESEKKELIKKLLELDTPNDEKVLEESGSKLNKDTKEILGSTEKNVAVEEKLKSMNLEKEIQPSKLIHEKLETSQIVKEQVNDKLNEMKDIIKQILQENNSSKSEAFSKVFQGLQEKMNDFKVFNSISNQYYYLDVPVNVNNKEYPCKLIIKDDRKKGKKIDSTNVKFVASVKTINMGVVDAYIKVYNTNINIDIKSDKDWVKVLELGKGKIEKKLNLIGFTTTVNVNGKELEADLINCRDFFEDNEFTRINLRV